MTEAHRDQREQLRAFQQQRWDRETQRRSERMSRGFRGIWDRLTGKYARIRQQNEMEAFQSFVRDRAETDRPIELQLEERRPLRRSIDRARADQAQDLDRLRAGVAHQMKRDREAGLDPKSEFRAARDYGRDIGACDHRLEPKP